MSSGSRRDNRDKLFEALKKAQAVRDGAALPLDATASGAVSRHGHRHMAFIAALVGAAAACAAIAWALSPD